MYRPYFGLSQLPFKTTPDLDMFYREGSRNEILQALAYTVVRGDGILKVVGEVGCGKTMILRLLASELGVEFKLVYVNSPNLSSKDMLLFICTELGLAVNETQQKFTLINLLQNKLFELHALGKRVVMLIDEAQAMTLDGLEEIRLLSNLETDREKLLQIVLFGQPELDKALEHPNIRQLKSRISYSIYIPPLSVTDVHSYLNFRMRKSGYAGIDVFDLSCARRIYKLTGGYPRNINVLADKLLMAVFSQQDKTVRSKHFRSIDGGNRRFPVAKVAGTGFVLLGLFIVAIYLTIYRENFAEIRVSIFEGVPTEAAIHPKNDMDEDVTGLSNYTVHSDVSSSLSVTDSPVPAETSVDTTSPSQENLAESLSVVLPESGFDLDSLVKQFYLSSQQIVQGLDAIGYSIQLATISLDSYARMQKEFERVGILAEDIRYVLDYKEGKTPLDKGILRLKVYLGNDQTYTQAKVRLQTLPDSLQRARPFIVSFNTIRREFNQALQFVNNTNGGTYATES